SLLQSSGDALRIDGSLEGVDACQSERQPGMDPVSTRRMHVTSKSGFGMLEATVAAVILVIGLVGLAGLFSQSLTFLQYTREDLIAKQKAREALESVYSARNDSTIGFAGIQNVSNGGIFIDGFNPLFLAGANGIVGTVGQTTILDRQILPGPDGIVGTADDEIIPLVNMKRQI